MPARRNVILQSETKIEPDLRLVQTDVDTATTNQKS